MVQTYTNEIYNNMINKDLNPFNICSGLFLCPRETHKATLKEYVKAILADKPVTKATEPTKKATYNILHLTDPHIDLEYQVVRLHIFCQINIVREQIKYVMNLYVAVQRMEFLLNLKKVLSIGVL